MTEQQKLIKELKIYDNICFNFEGELRVDTITSAECFVTGKGPTVAYGTVNHGIIRPEAIRAKLTPSLKEIYENQTDRKLDLEVE